MKKEPRFWIKYNLKKDNSILRVGFSTLQKANAYAKELRGNGYNPVFDREKERESCVLIAMNYLNGNKSFRSFENEQNISGVESPSIWAEAAKKRSNSHVHRQ